MSRAVFSKAELFFVALIYVGMWYGGEGKRRTLEFLEVGGDLLLRKKSVGGGGGGGDGEGGGDGGREGSGEGGGGGGLQVFHFSAKVIRPSSFLSFFFFCKPPIKEGRRACEGGGVSEKGFSPPLD